jgi:hypothetical protein
MNIVKEPFSRVFSWARSIQQNDKKILPRNFQKGNLPGAEVFAPG